MNENIYSSFRKELGYTNVSNQYVEMLMRSFEKNNQNINKNDLQICAKNVDLHISELTEDYKSRISRNYIVNINTCFENFLKSFKNFSGSPTNISDTEKSKDETWLGWTIQVAFKEIPQDIKNDFYICEYYRLIRNRIVHNGKELAKEKSAIALIKKEGTSRLNAPNNFDSIIFDDQILFSRAANNIAKYIFNNSKYDIEKVIATNKNELIDIVRPLQESCSQEKAVIKIERFLKIRYPKFEDVIWNDIINMLVKEINNERH